MLASVARLGVQSEYLFRMTTPLNTIFTEPAASYLQDIEGAPFLGARNGTLAPGQCSGTLYAATACKKIRR